jgi:hypothetical protein
MFCETCPFFDRTPENIKSVRAARDYQIKKDLEEIEKEQRARAYYQAETDRVWNEYCEQQKKNEEKKYQAETNKVWNEYSGQQKRNEEKKYLSAADEYAEYLRLKEKFEKE